jgi:hypothetical protein
VGDEWESSGSKQKKGSQRKIYNVSSNSLVVEAENCPFSKNFSIHALLLARLSILLERLSATFSFFFEKGILEGSLTNDVKFMLEF